jgi:hypothetical protein
MICLSPELFDEHLAPRISTRFIMEETAANLYSKLVPAALLDPLLVRLRCRNAFFPSLSSRARSSRLPAHVYVNLQHKAHDLGSINIWEQGLDSQYWHCKFALRILF